jgi:ribosomal protein L19
MALRVMAKVRGDDADKDEVTRLLGCESDREKLKGWCLHAPEKEGADLDSQVDWILGRVSRDFEVWKRVTDEYRVDLFVGLFLERPNRGISLSAKTMTELGARGIEMGFDIYAPER